jgi:hypothetical protein
MTLYESILHGVGWSVNVEQLVEWELVGETVGVLGETHPSAAFLITWSLPFPE